MYNRHLKVLLFDRNYFANYSAIDEPISLLVYLVNLFPVCVASTSFSVAMAKRVQSSVFC